MWKKFEDEKPEIGKALLIRRNGFTLPFVGLVQFYNDDLNYNPVKIRVQTTSGGSYLNGDDEWHEIQE